MPVTGRVGSGRDLAAVLQGQAVGAGGIRLGDVPLGQSVVAEEQVIPGFGQVVPDRGGLRVQVVGLRVEGRHHGQAHVGGQVSPDGFDAGGSG